jgi:hypothetical protein
VTATPEPTGLHGLDFGDGFLAVFCERENLLAMYPHQCPADEPAFPTDAEAQRAATETRYALEFHPLAADHQARLASGETT